MKIKPTPCYNCIVLAMCKGKVQHITPNMNKSTIYISVTDLTDNCSLLDDYIRPRENYLYDIYNRRLAVHYLTGIDLGGEQEGLKLKIERLYERTEMENPHKIIHVYPEWTLEKEIIYGQ
jgi:hypothetical protein